MGEARWYPASEPKALFGSLDGRGREGLKKKEERSGKNGELWEGRALRGLVFFIIQNPPDLGELQNCIGAKFG